MSDFDFIFDSLSPYRYYISIGLFLVALIILLAVNSSLVYGMASIVLLGVVIKQDVFNPLNKHHMNTKNNIKLNDEVKEFNEIPVIKESEDERFYRLEKELKELGEKTHNELMQLYNSSNTDEKKVSDIEDLVRTFVEVNTRHAFKTDSKYATQFKGHLITGKFYDGLYAIESYLSGQSDAWQPDSPKEKLAVLKGHLDNMLK